MAELIHNFRSVEDTLACILLTIALALLLNASVKLKGIPLRVIPFALFWGLFPLYVWKTIGMIRRVFMDKAANPDLYKTLHDIGEAFESLSGLILAISFIYILMQLRKLSTS